jgi:hypothetical protein
MMTEPTTDAAEVALKIGLSTEELFIEIEHMTNVVLYMAAHTDDERLSGALYGAGHGLEHFLGLVEEKHEEMLDVLRVATGRQPVKGLAS